MKQCHQAIRQQGAVLILGLAFVLILSVMVVSAARTTVLQQKMSGNLRDKELAFQAAESALKSAEQYLHTNKQQDLVGQFTNQNGLHLYDVSRDWQQDATWDNKSPIEAGTLYQVRNKPVYVIEELPNIEVVGDSLSIPRPVSSTHYRITAKSKGGTDASLVVLQSMYKK